MAESAVIGVPHEIKGQGLVAFVTVIEGRDYDDELRKELVAMIDKSIGKFARPEQILPPIYQRLALKLCVVFSEILQKAKS